MGRPSPCTTLRTSTPVVQLREHSRPWGLGATGSLQPMASRDSLHSPRGWRLGGGVERPTEYHIARERALQTMLGDSQQTRIDVSQGCLPMVTGASVKIAGPSSRESDGSEGVYFPMSCFSDKQGLHIGDPHSRQCELHDSSFLDP